jgi:tRNA modification GTPase
MTVITDTDNICAIATPPGKGGVSILRISGSNLSVFLSKFVSKKLEPRSAVYASFTDDENVIIDKGIAI